MKKPGNDASSPESGAIIGTRRDMFSQGAMMLGAVAMAGPFAAACAQSATSAAQENEQSAQKPAASQSLYDRLGGIFAIAGVVDHFSNEIIKDPVAGAKSSNPSLRDWHTKQLTRLPGLKFMRTLWVAKASGGPFEYTPVRPGKTNLGLEEAHRQLKISPTEFDAVAAVLSRSLDHFKVPEREKGEVLAAFAAHRAEVTQGWRETQPASG